MVISAGAGILNIPVQDCDFRKRGESARHSPMMTEPDYQKV